MLSTHSRRSLAEVPHAGVSAAILEEASRALIGQETGFGEVHFLIGQRAVLNGNLAGAYRELTRARELLPDSASISLVLANVTLSYARYAEALALFDAHPASPPARTEAAGAARPREVAELSQAARRSDRRCSIESAEGLAEQSWREILLARVEPAAARPAHSSPTTMRRRR